MPPRTRSATRHSGTVMAWRRYQEPPRIEPPDWYRRFDPAMWDAPDAQERSMIDSCRSFRPWPAWLHEHHSRRRWEEAKFAYRQDHPALAEQEFQELVDTARDRGL
jgi:hypothetical protein